MKRCRVWLAAAAGLVLIAALGLFFLSRPSLFNTVRFHSRHQALLEEFISLCREEAARPGERYGLAAIYTAFPDHTLTTLREGLFLEEWEERPAAPNLRAAWEAIARHRYFTSVSCSFDEGGALEIHFSTEGEWIPYGTPTEGHYYIAHCLVWRDADYSGLPHADYWNSLGEAREQGGWYYTSHKHRDG